MVNIPLLIMDEYGLLEPTDVGTMTIEYDPKDESKRRVNRWDQEEVVCMLNLIKENNFVTRYSVNKMSSLLSQLMIKKGWNRTERQIHLKLTTMRKNFLACERQKLINGNLKECPFYRELREVYRDVNNVNGIDSEDYDTSSQDECIIKFPSDPIDWTRGEVQKMLNIIKSMKIKNELTLTFFAPIAVRMIAEAMQNAGYDRSIEQVKNALINLRTMYIDFKIGFDNNESPSECMFFSCLDMFWGREYKKCRLKEKRKIRSDDSWSTEETIVLLTLIQDLKIAEDAYKNSEKSAEDLKQSLIENGYCRSKLQIMNRLDQLKTDFINVHTSYTEAEAVQRFPFYTLYKKLFELQFSDEVMNHSDSSTDKRRDSLEYIDFCQNAKETSQKLGKVTVWLKDEVKLLLKTIKELTSGSQWNDSLEDKKLQKLVKTLGDAGYYKTVEQIKHKLSLLKNSYLKCNLEDNTERNIFACPFYNELHAIFHTPASDESYTNLKFDNTSSENKVHDKVTVVPNKCIDSWFPVESIIDEDGISTSSPLDFSNLSAVSSKEQQAIEDALLAALPNNSDSRSDENHTISEDPILNSKDIIIPEDRVPSVITDVAFNEVVTTGEEKEDVSKIYKFEDPDSRGSTNLITRRTALSGDDDGPPTSKKPKIVEDEKIAGKNKFLLRPVDMNPSSLNITNTKFVRLIVANEPNKNRVNHITAHIEPMNINTANSVSSGMSSPVDRADIFKMAADKALLKDDYVIHKLENDAEMLIPKKECTYNGSESYSENKNSANSTEAKISETIREAVQSMMKHDELMQQKHHAWMEKQFEIQRKHDEDQKKILMSELKELRSIITVLLANKQPHANSQNR